ncbi:MAG: hypothetical protein JHC33_01085 [Ignisphaera sp.]|nr:hypothetical protein [Ignisphaera sp.]
MANAMQKFNSPVGNLAWVFITGNGKKDLNGNDRFVASLEFHKDDPALKQLEAQIMAFWEANKPSGAKLPKSTGIKVVKDKDGNPTDMRSVNFWTGTTNSDGSPKVIKTYNSKAVEVNLGNKKIGNGSRGAISGTMAIFDQGVANRGVTLYLNAIQITKFVEYQDGPGFTAAAEEDGWTGEDSESGFEPQAEPAARPKL